VKVSTVLVSFLFAVFLLTVPPLRVQLFVKVGARAPVPYGVGATALDPRRGTPFSGGRGATGDFWKVWDGNSSISMQVYKLHT